MRDWLLPYTPSHTSISATDGHSRSIATRILSRQVGAARDFEEALARGNRLSAPHFCTMIVFGPSWLIESRSELSNPRMSDVMPTIDVMPMTTPSTVSAERILLVRSVSTDIVTISPSSPVLSAAMCQSSKLLSCQLISYRRESRHRRIRRNADSSRTSESVHAREP